MKTISAFRKVGIIPITAMAIVLFFAVSMVQAATTLSTNIATDGTMSVTGASTFTGLASMRQASSTRLSIFDIAYFGGTATSTFSSAGVLTLITPLAITSGGTGQASFGQGWLHSSDSTITSSTSPTVNYIVATSTTATSTFAAGIQSTYLNITGTAATSTFARGIDLAGGCFSINGTCVGGGAGTVTSVGLSDSNSTLTIGGTPVTTSGTLTATLNLAHGNSWTALQQFSNASSSLFSSYGPSYFGATATSSFSSAGVLTLITPLAITSGGTGQASFGQGWLHSSDSTITSSTSPTVNYIVATSTTATSTFAAGVQTAALNVTSTAATSTFARGIDLAGGCFSIGGTCIGGSSASTVVRSARTSNTILAVADQGKLIDVTSGTFTQTFTAAATLGSGWWVYYRNSGTGDVTLDPNGTETIDSLTTFIMYPGETRLIQSDGTNLNSIVINKFYASYTSTGTFTVPPGYSGITARVIGGGGGGGSGSRWGVNTVRGGGTGGGGGARTENIFHNLTAGSSVTITIGAGGGGGTAQTVDDSVGVNGAAAGGTSSFGTMLYAYGGGYGSGGHVGTATAGGGGGGSAGAGQNGVVNTGTRNGGSPISTYLGTGGDATSANIGSGGGGSGTTENAYGNAEYGGGGGGGSVAGGTGNAGGSSLYGAGGGAAGGGQNSGNTGIAGQAGGATNSYTQGGGGAGGATPGGSGTAGAAGSNGLSGAGGGGGAGRSSGGGVGGAGAAGGAPGGGGGGGGGSSNSYNSGAGGAGADGAVYVWGM